VLVHGLHGLALIISIPLAAPVAGVLRGVQSRVRVNGLCR
jgi:hypothetical protein